jgi:hypothetical protein
MAATNAPKPANERRRRNKPVRGEWTPALGVGWQHNPLPPAPDGLVEASRVAWETWFRAWFAAHWTPDDVPGLRKVIQLYDATERGEMHRASELRQLMDTYGITPKGQQDRRWTRPKAEEPAQPVAKSDKPTGPYAHLRVVNE